MIMERFPAGIPHSFTVKKFTTRVELGRQAAVEVSAAIQKLLKDKAEIAMIFAAAPSQSEFLAMLTADSAIDFSRIHAFHMDEYIGLSTDAPQGFGNFLRDRLFSKVKFASVNYISSSGDPQAECDRYSALLRKNPPDIICMGIGENGHIAFNDPHVALFNDPALVKIVDLDEVCRNQQVNDGCFSTLSDVPKQALTLTIPALQNACYHFCMVPAKTKAWAVRETIYGEISEKCPATILRVCPNATFYIDADSGSLL